MKTIFALAVFAVLMKLRNGQKIVMMKNKTSLSYAILGARHTRLNTNHYPDNNP